MTKMGAWAVLVKEVADMDKNEHYIGKDDDGGGVLGLREGEDEQLGRVKVHGKDVVDEVVGFYGIKVAKVLAVNSFLGDMTKGTAIYAKL